MKILSLLPVLLALTFTSFAGEPEENETANEIASETPIGILETSPIEDLMREHGMTSRLLLIYEEIEKRIDAGRLFPPQALERTAQIISSFVENYHEKLEEEYIFARFEKAGQMLDLIKTLKEQHDKGRGLTAQILSLSKHPDITLYHPEIKELLSAYIKMYRPHAAREDTVLFPAFKKLISESDYEELGAVFEKKEHALFGENGFDDLLADVVGIEKDLGIYNLSLFTPETVTPQSTTEEPPTTSPK